MDLIIGGAWQGKTEYALCTYMLEAGQMLDGRDMDLEKKENICSVKNVQLCIKRLLEKGMDPRQWIEELLDRNPDIILVMDEVGNGIIPMQREERLFRESVGICGCLLAKRARRVVRLVCGIPQVLKEAGEA